MCSVGCFAVQDGTGYGIRLGRPRRDNGLESGTLWRGAPAQLGQLLLVLHVVLHVETTQLVRADLLVRQVRHSHVAPRIAVRRRQMASQRTRSLSGRSLGW